MWTLTDVERAVRTSWGIDTCDPVDRPDWHPDNPARGQCGVTAQYELLRKRVLSSL